MTVEQQPTLSPTEWQVMSAVWALENADANRVSAWIQERHGRTYPPKTVGIFLARLAQKGFLCYTTIRPIGPGRPAYIYSPSVAREHALRRQIQKFVADYLVEAADLDTFHEIVSPPSLSRLK